MKNIKTKLCVILLLGIGLTAVEAQTTVTTAGGNASSSSGSASFTVGQLVFNTNSNSGGSVSQGVQQPYEIIVVGIEEIHGINLNLSAYPNPMTDFITLKVEKDNHNELSYQIFDINGRLLANKNVLDNETNIQVSNFVSGTYFLKVLQNNKEVKTFKITKN